MTKRGIVAAGHQDTAEAARSVLADGGHAFDAVLAGLAAACVAEPLLSSLGGGGFLLAQEANGDSLVYDFFSQTPLRKHSGESDFYPIQGDFGGTTQEFHIGLGSVAVPGVIRGLFEIHRDLGRMPMPEILEPAITLARKGARHNASQAYVEQILAPILHSTEAMRRLFPDGRSLFRNPDLADFLEVLGHEGDDLFYLGETARRIARDCDEGGGHLTLEDFRDYRVVRRAPLVHRHGGARISLNPAPSSGGTMIALTLALLEENERDSQPISLVQAQRLTNKARQEAIEGRLRLGRYLRDPGHLQTALEQCSQLSPASRGTTHLSVADQQGNIASLTVSNGEGSGYVVPDTGILLNNFLGEEDLHPHGLESWAVDQRMSSMMCPTLVDDSQGRLIALGSGGSNRLRTAIVQVLLGLLDFGMPLERAVFIPRVHYEKAHLDFEPGHPQESIEAWLAEFPNAREWRERNLFFGGVHAVEIDRERGHFSGIGDPRRDGVCLIVE